jgi:pimeloyl-ACP methyl ester carboxylesterase
VRRRASRHAVWYERRVMDPRLLVPTVAAAVLAGGPLLLPSTPAPGTRPGRELADPDGRFARVLGVDVHHRVAGDDDAPALLLSHHFYGSVGTWGKLQPLLAADHRVVSFDRPGFGLTERLPRERWQGVNPYTREGAARIGWGLLDHLGIEEAVLVGSSAGGTNVLEMYARHPERVRALVLLSPAITGDVGAPPPLRPLLRTPQGRRLGPLLARKLAGEIDVRRVAKGWHDPEQATDADAEPYRQMLQVDGWDVGFWELMTAEGPPDLREVVRSIAVPTLVVGGASDRVISMRLNRRTAAAIDGAQLIELPDVGHTPQEEAPERLAEVLRGFLAFALDG